ncbi:Uncharacterised protein [uncultured archaeon]|nr:Uncharacterised protein [uncultured archaeon]
MSKTNRMERELFLKAARVSRWEKAHPISGINQTVRVMNGKIDPRGLEGIDDGGDY